MCSAETLLVQLRTDQLHRAALETELLVGPSCRWDFRMSQPAGRFTGHMLAMMPGQAACIVRKHGHVWLQRSTASVKAFPDIYVTLKIAGCTWQHTMPRPHPRSLPLPARAECLGKSCRSPVQGTDSALRARARELAKTRGCALPGTIQQARDNAARQPLLRQHSRIASAHNGCN